MNEEFIDCIKTRRSIRKYLAQPVEKKTIDQIIQAGKYAPSAENTQPWRFIVITNPNIINELSKGTKIEIKNLLKWRHLLRFKYPELRDRETLKFLFGVSMVEQDSIFFNAPVVVFIVTEKKRFYDESCACCAENMMLAAHALELGSCWIGFAHFIDLNKQLSKKIGIPDGHHISAALIFGHPDGNMGKPSIRKPCSDVINWIGSDGPVG